MSSMTTPVQRDAKASAQEAKKLLKAGRKAISDETRERVEDLIARVENEKDPLALRKAVDALNSEMDRSLAHWRKSKSREYFESIAIAVLVALSIRAFIFEPYKIPSPSMVPTLLVGDRIWVSKGAYGIRIPFTQRYLMQWRELERGDVVVFQFPREHAETRDRMGEWIQRFDAEANLPASMNEWRDSAGFPIPTQFLRDSWGSEFKYGTVDSKLVQFDSAGPDRVFGTSDDITLEQVRASMVSFPDQRRPSGEDLPHRCPIDPWSLSSSKTYIKRIVGLPGDTVELRDNHFILNGTPVERSPERVGPASHYRGGRVPSKLFTETLPDGGPTYNVRTIFEDENFGPLTVPEGHVFAMGDNRDESSDGRCWGLVPSGHVKGLAKFVMFSVASEGGFESGRFFLGIE